MFWTPSAIRSDSLKRTGALVQLRRLSVDVVVAEGLDDCAVGEVRTLGTDDKGHSTNNIKERDDCRILWRNQIQLHLEPNVLSQHVEMCGQCAVVFARDKMCVRVHPVKCSVWVDAKQKSGWRSELLVLVNNRCWLFFFFFLKPCPEIPQAMIDSMLNKSRCCRSPLLWPFIILSAVLNFWETYEHYAVCPVMKQDARIWWLFLKGEDAHLHWPHSFTKWEPWHVLRTVFGSIISRTDDRDESERSLSPSYLHVSLWGKSEQDLSLRRTRWSCFPRDAWAYWLSTKSTCSHTSWWNFLIFGRRPRVCQKLHADGPSISQESKGLEKPLTSFHLPSVAHWAPQRWEPSRIGKSVSSKDYSLILVDWRLLPFDWRQAAPLKSPATKTTCSSSLTLRIVRRKFDGTRKWRNCSCCCQRSGTRHVRLGAVCSVFEEHTTEIPWHRWSDRRRYSCWRR